MMNRDKWRDLCTLTRQWERSIGRYVHISTFLVPTVNEQGKTVFVPAHKGSTYRNHK